MKGVHCPLLLIDTGLMSIGPLTNKQLQKHCPTAIAKNEENVHFPHGPLLKAPLIASSPGLMHIKTACVG